MSRSARGMGRPRLAMKHKGVYLTKKEADIIREKASSLASVGQLSEQEKKVFEKIRQRIKSPDTMMRADHGQKVSSDRVWLSPNEAKFLLAWKEAALEGKVTKQGVRHGFGIVPVELIAIKWKGLFKEKKTIQYIRSLKHYFEYETKIHLRQANVSLLKDKERGRPGKLGYLSKEDSKIIKLRTIDKLNYEKIGKKLGKSRDLVGRKIKHLKKLGYEL